MYPDLVSDWNSEIISINEKYKDYIIVDEPFVKVEPGDRLENGLTVADAHTAIDKNHFYGIYRAPVEQRHNA